MVLPVPERQPGDKITLVANVVFLFLELHKNGLPTWRWHVDLGWLWLTIDIGWLQGSGISLLTLGLEPHVWAHAPCTLAHSYSHHSAPYNLPYPRKSWWGRAAGNLYPITPTIGILRNNPFPPQAPDHSPSHPLWVAALVFWGFWDNCFTNHMGPSNQCPLLPPVNVGMYCSPQAILSCERWGQTFLVQSFSSVPTGPLPVLPTVWKARSTLKEITF